MCIARIMISIHTFWWSLLFVSGQYYSHTSRLLHRRSDDCSPQFQGGIPWKCGHMDPLKSDDITTAKLNLSKVWTYVAYRFNGLGWMSYATVNTITIADPLSQGIKLSDQTYGAPKLTAFWSRRSIDIISFRVPVTDASLSLFLFERFIMCTVRW